MEKLVNCPHCKNEISVVDEMRCPDCGNVMDYIDTGSFVTGSSSDLDTSYRRILLLIVSAFAGVFIVPTLCLMLPFGFKLFALLVLVSLCILIALPAFYFLRFVVSLFKNRSVGIGCVVGFFGLAGFFMYYSPLDLYDKYFRADTCIKKASKTTITAHLNEVIGAENNVIYCASFQKAWDKLHDDVFKEDIQFASHPVMAKELNKQLLRPEDLSEDSYVAEAGPWTADLVSRINRELQKKFRGEASGYSISEAPADRRRILAYAFLYKNLEFPRKFEKLHTPIQFKATSGETPLKAFGVDPFSTSNEVHKKLSSQVRVLYYRNSNEFALSLSSKSKDDEIILAKIMPGKSLLETYKKMTTMIAPTYSLVNGEILRIPKVDFDITHHFRELEHQDILNRGWNDWFIETAEQQIKFRLDETGAILKSRVFLVSALKEEAPLPIAEPRRFIFDKPFLICLKQKKGQLPYFSMWVNNPELMVKK